MPLSHRSLDSISEQDLQALVDEGVREGRRIEYKRQLPGNSDEEKRELLADVSSLANASGGDLIYGIQEQSGLPIALAGVTGDADAEVLRLESTIRGGIDPRIPGIHLRPIQLSSGNFVLIIRIPQSWALPHMVTFKGLSRFFSRTSAGKYQLDVSELRALFARSTESGERIRSFRDDRLARIVAGEGSFQMTGSALIVLHMIPLRLFDPSTRINASLASSMMTKLAPLYTMGYSQRYNLDGYATFRAAEESPSTSTYVQVFRHGAVEAVEAQMLAPRNETRHLIRGGLLVRELVEKVPTYLEVQRNLGVDLPIVVLVTLLGVKGYLLAAGRTWEDYGNPVDRNVVSAPEIIIEDWSTPVTTALRPALDALWNAAGWARCNYYNKQGDLDLP